MTDNELTQTYYVDSKSPRYRLYALLLVIVVIIVMAFVFTTTESNIDTIAKKYPDRVSISDSNDAENVAFAMQLLFKETGFILDDASSSLP